MSLTERVQAALRSAVAPSQKPTQSQVLEISGLTHIPDACKEIQVMLHRRLKHTELYEPPETYHTLILIQKCLGTASADFVNFCTSEVQLIVSLTHYERSWTPAEREMDKLISARATAVSKILLDPAGLAEKRDVLLAESASTVAPPPLQKNIPLPTPPSSPDKSRKFGPSRPLMGGLHTPDPSPPQAFPRMGLNNQLNSNVRDPGQSTLKGHETSASSGSIFLMSKDEVARMTFESAKLDYLVRVLDDRLRAGLSQRNNTDELVKSLTLVHHCLFWGSAPFLAHCRDMKGTFNALRQHPVALVRSRSEAVTSLLEDSPRLLRERQFRATLVPQTATSSEDGEQPSTALVPKTPRIHADNSNVPRIFIQEPVLDLSDRVTKIGSRPVTGGGYSDVWKGEYITELGRKMVAIKILRRLNKVPPERLEKRLNRELRAWRTVIHDNITPFYGVVIDPDGEVGMVSPFYSDGNAVEYTKRNQGIDPLKMLQGIARGVEYLHANRIVHGDIKGSNVMINETGVPKLIDFGLAQFLDEFAVMTGYTTSNLATSLRWSAPELLVGDGTSSSKTENSDVYAFASLCIEIMTLRSPYDGKRDPQVLNHVLRGGIPERPSMDEKWSPCDELWDFLRTCWRWKPEDRPNIVAVKRKLGEFFNGSEIPSPLPRQVRFSG